MRILFVKVRLTSGSSLGGLENSVLEPLEFEYLAGALLHHDVQCLDLRREPPGALESTLGEYRPHVVASTANTVDVYVVQELFRTVKRWDPEILTVIGGYHVTHWAEDFGNVDVDVIVQGQGEIAFRDVVDRFESTGRNFRDIPGLVIPYKGRLFHTGKRLLVPIDTVQPDRRIISKYRPGYHCEYWMPCAMVRNTWGCLHRCSFCALWSLAEGKLWERDVERLCDEVEGLSEKYVFFCDDLSFSLKSTRRMERFCEEMERRHVHKQFYFTCRSDVVARSPDLVGKLARAGMTRIFLGLEANSNDAIAGWNKCSKVEINEQAIRLLHSFDVDVTGSFLVTPDFTRQQFEQLFEYVDRLGILCPAFLIYTPHPGVHVHDDRGWVQNTENYEFYDHLHTVFETRLPAEEFYRCFSELWRRSYSPLSRTGYRRFLRIVSRVSPRLLPHAAHMGIEMFRRMARGASVVDRYREGGMSNSGRPRLAQVELIPACELPSWTDSQAIHKP
jgi:hopanoid C-3 methylase